MKIERLSPKQGEVLTWWCTTSRHFKKDAIICDGAVRSGKTLCLSLSFLIWSMSSFHGYDFALCGKTVTSLRRNLLTPLVQAALPLGFECKDKISRNLLEVSYAGRKNRFHLFGGKDEGSASLIQGVTLAGVLFDEVALMPRSFVEQALARCSVDGSRFWFNCNPEHPRHWFYTEWIQNPGSKNAFRLQFKMQDNPALSPAMLKRYQSLYTGVFYERFVLGNWVAAHGAVYPMFDITTHVVTFIPNCSRFVISCDYGTMNPSSFGLWGESNGTWYRIKEYYHDARRTGIINTDEEYCNAMEELAGTKEIEAVVVDPSAASFIQCIRKRGKYRVVPAANDVINGIRLVQAALAAGRLLFQQDCADTLREFCLYRWDPDATKDIPVKEHDHAMDDIRYFCSYVESGGGQGFAVVSAKRAGPP